MRKSFIILFFTFTSILPSFSYANVNVHPVGSQAWHDFNNRYYDVGTVRSWQIMHSVEKLINDNK